MTTTANEALRWKQRQIIAAYPSAVNSGTVPDQAHLARGGYHVSIEDLVRYGNAGDYSNSRPLDKAPPVTAAGRRLCAADDISMSPADMKLHHDRVMRVYRDRTDPRRKYLGYINTWDGSGDAIRIDFIDNDLTRATDDHKWHRHGDNPRLYLDLDADPDRVWKAMRATVSVETGQSSLDWIKQEEGDDMGTVESLTPAALKQIVEAIVWHTAHTYEQYDKDGKPVGTAYSLLNTYMQTHARAGAAERNTAAIRTELAKLAAAVAAIAAGDADDATKGELADAVRRMEELAEQDRQRDEGAIAAAAQQHAELVELLGRYQSGEMDAEAVVDELLKRLATLAPATPAAG